MSFLDGVSEGASDCGLRIVVYSQEKMGKTSMGAGAPDVLLVPCEVGYAGVTCAKTPMVQNWNQLLECMADIFAKLEQGVFKYKSITFDSATAVERFTHEAVLAQDPASANKKANNMELAFGGYGKAYPFANAMFVQWTQWLDILAIKYGINIILTCHAFSSKVIDPTAGEFDSWDLLLHSPKNNKTYGKREIITQWADIVGFLYEPLFVSESGRVSKGVSQNKGRVLACSRTPSYTAGNRFSIMGEVNLPVPPNNSWNALAHAVYSVSGIDVFNRVKP